MKKLFAWLVRNEKLVIAFTGILALGLFVQIRFCNRRVDPAVDPVLSKREPFPITTPSKRTSGLTGFWEMTVQKRKGGSQIWTLSLEQNGQSLKGVISSEGGDLNVTGAINGQSIYLSAKRFGVTVEFPATLNGDTMTGTMRALTVTQRWSAKPR